MAEDIDNIIFPCGMSAEKIMEYAGDELNKSDTDKVARHIADCPDCMALYNDIKNINIRVSNETAEFDVPAGLHKKLIKDAKKEASRRRRLTFIGKYSWIAAAAVVCLMVACSSIVIRMSQIKENDMIGEKTQESMCVADTEIESPDYSNEKGEADGAVNKPTDAPTSDLSGQPCKGDAENTTIVPVYEYIVFHKVINSDSDADVIITNSDKNNHEEQTTNTTCETIVADETQAEIAQTVTTAAQDTTCSVSYDVPDEAYSEPECMYDETYIEAIETLADAEVTEAGQTVSGSDTILNSIVGKWNFTDSDRTINLTVCRDGQIILVPDTGKKDCIDGIIKINSATGQFTITLASENGDTVLVGYIYDGYIYLSYLSGVELW